MNQQTSSTQQLSTAQEAKLARAKRAARRVGLIVPLILTLVAVALNAIWLPRMPDPAAIHWSGGSPDGFGALKRVGFDGG